MFYFLSFDGDKFETFAASTCDHDSTYGLANYRGKPMITGSWYNPNCSIKTEIYDFESKQWKNALDYPYNP